MRPSSGSYPTTAATSSTASIAAPWRLSKAVTPVPRIPCQVPRTARVRGPRTARRLQHPGSVGRHSRCRERLTRDGPLRNAWRAVAYVKAGSGPGETTAPGEGDADEPDEGQAIRFVGDRIEVRSAGSTPGEGDQPRCRPGDGRCRRRHLRAVEEGNLRGGVFCERLGHLARGRRPDDWNVQTPYGSLRRERSIRQPVPASRRSSARRVR